MNNLTATVKTVCNLALYAKAINNGRTDGIYFYVNDNKVSVSSPYVTLSEAQQLEELGWFLKGKEYDIN
jgi:hypothetical protein